MPWRLHQASPLLASFEAPLAFLHHAHMSLECACTCMPHVAWVWRDNRQAALAAIRAARPTAVAPLWLHHHQAYLLSSCQSQPKRHVALRASHSSFEHSYSAVSPQPPRRLRYSLRSRRLRASLQRLQTFHATHKRYSARVGATFFQSHRSLFSHSIDLAARLYSPVNPRELRRRRFLERRRSRDTRPTGQNHR